MKVRRRIEIVAVKETTYSPRESSVESWCEGCRAHLPMYTPTIAATLTGKNLRTLFRWIESGAIHYVETPDGNILLCLESVRAQTRLIESEVVFSHGSCTTTGNHTKGSSDY